MERSRLESPGSHVFHVGLGAGSPRHNLPAALILEDDFDLQPDFARPASQRLGRNRFFPEALNLTVGADDEFFLLHNRSVEVK